MKLWKEWWKVEKSYTVKIASVKRFVLVTRDVLAWHLAEGLVELELVDVSGEVLEKDGKTLSGSGCHLWIRKMVDQGMIDHIEKGAWKEWKVVWFRT